VLGNNCAINGCFEYLSGVEGAAGCPLLSVPDWFSDGWSGACGVSSWLLRPDAGPGDVIVGLMTSLLPLAVCLTSMWFEG
jgi:hypothetical protein